MPCYPPIEQTMVRGDFHSALKTEQLDTHSGAGVQFLRVKLQYGKTDITYSLHANPSSFSFSGLQTTDVLAMLGFRRGGCPFFHGQCYAKEIPEDFDVEGFSKAFNGSFRALDEAYKHFEACGYPLEFPEGIGYFSGRPSTSRRRFDSFPRPYGDGHTSPISEKMKESEDEVFKFVFSWIEGGRDKGWTIHLTPKHPPLSEDIQRALSFLGEFRSVRECPILDFEPCQWRFIPFQERPGTFEMSNADFAHRSFDAHAEHFSLGLEKLISADAAIQPFGMNILPPVKRFAPDGPAIRREEVPRREKPVSPAAKRPFKYDVALSFAGTERSPAEKLATILREKGVEVFYDAFYPEHLWGKDLAVEFDKIYRKESRFCVIFSSNEYAKRMWTIHERRSALARFLEEKGKEYILPIKIENVDLDGIPPTIGYLSIDEFPIEKIVELLLKKLSGK